MYSSTKHNLHTASCHHLKKRLSIPISPFLHCSISPQPLPFWLSPYGLSCLYVIYIILKKKYIYICMYTDLREEGEIRASKRRENHWLDASYTPTNGDQVRNLSMCPDLDWPELLFHRSMLNQSHAGQDIYISLVYNTQIFFPSSMMVLDPLYDLSSVPSP